VVPPAAALADAAALAADGSAVDALEGDMLPVWRSVLGVPDVEGGDNFFDLGGHSLLAARLVREIQARSPEMRRDAPRCAVWLVRELRARWSELVRGGPSWCEMARGPLEPEARVRGCRRASPSR